MNLPSSSANDCTVNSLEYSRLELSFVIVSIPSILEAFNVKWLSLFLQTFLCKH